MSDKHQKKNGSGGGHTLLMIIAIVSGAGVAGSGVCRESEIGR